MDVITCDYLKLGKRIAEHRSALGWKQAELAERSDLSAGFIGKVETGAGLLSVKSLVQIANALGTTTDILLYDSTTVHYTKYDMDIKNVTDGLSEKQKDVILETIKAMAESMKKHHL